MKINLLVISLFISFVLNAQIKKEILFIGGDIQIYGSKFQSADVNQYTRRTNIYNFYPSVGWAIKDNVLVGGKLLLSFFNDVEEHPSDFQSKGNRIGAGIWIRKYLPLGKSFFLFAEAGLNGQSIYMKQLTTLQPAHYREKGYAVNAAIYPGISFRVKKSLMLEAALNNLVSLGYENKNTEQGNPGTNLIKGKITSYNLSSSLGNNTAFQIGLRWVVDKK